MGGNTYSRKNFNDREIDHLIQKIDGYKSLFDDRVFDSEKVWRANISRHLDSNSCQRFYFRLAKPHYCKHCSKPLEIESFNYVTGFRPYCPDCTNQEIWKKTNTPDSLKVRGQKISARKLQYYQTEEGKRVAKENGKKISKSLKKFHQTEEGRLAREKSRVFNSKYMKKRILTGKFTPNSNNRNTHWESKYRNKSYRSSWEAAFQQLNPEAEYETLRIKYLYQETEYIYIVDFIDHKRKIVTEVKPYELTGDQKFLAKLAALRTWAQIHQYTVQLADQKYFADRIDLLNFDDFDNQTSQKLKKAFIK